MRIRTRKIEKGIELSRELQNITIEESPEQTISTETTKGRVPTRKARSTKLDYQIDASMVEKEKERRHES